MIDWFYWLRWLGAQMTIAALVYPIMRLWRVL
jgi:hypothetical protein